MSRESQPKDSEIVFGEKQVIVDELGTFVMQIVRVSNGREILVPVGSAYPDRPLPTRE